jgi:hypothetical protein
LRFYVRFSERQKSTALEQFTHHYVANTAPGRRRCRDNNDQPGNDGNDVARHRFIVGTNRFGMISPQVPHGKVLGHPEWIVREFNVASFSRFFHRHFNVI